MLQRAKEPAKVQTTEGLKRTPLAQMCLKANASAQSDAAPAAPPDAAAASIIAAGATAPTVSATPVAAPTQRPALAPSPALRTAAEPVASRGSAAAATMAAEDAGGSAPAPIAALTPSLKLVQAMSPAPAAVPAPGTAAAPAPASTSEAVSAPAVAHAPGRPIKASEARRPRSEAATQTTGGARPAAQEPHGVASGSVRGQAAAPRRRPPRRHTSAGPEVPEQPLPAAPAGGQRRPGFGKVPVFVKQRKAELAEEKRKAALPPEPTPPMGYRRIEEAERLMTLETLRQRRKEVEAQIRALPLRIETLGQRQREQDLSKRVAQVEKLLVMFNKPVVFVPEDAEPIRDVGGPLAGAGAR